MDKLTSQQKLAIVERIDPNDPIALLDHLRGHGIGTDFTFKHPNTFQDRRYYFRAWPVLDFNAKNAPIAESKDCDIHKAMKAFVTALIGPID